MVGKMTKVSAAAIATFIFALPLFLSIFIPLVVVDSLTYLMLYIFLSALLMFLSALLLVYSIFENRAIKLFIPCATASAVLVIMFVIFIAVNDSLSNESEFIIGADYNKFNSKKWQKAGLSGSDSREYMLKDLTKNILPNKNIEEVINLLGDPYAVISEQKRYYSYSTDGNTVFRLSHRDENGNITSQELIDKKSLYDSEIMKSSMIYYITGSGLIDNSTLDIYFDENGIFKEYKLGQT
jgi:hypothetical protein